MNRCATPLLSLLVITGGCRLATTEPPQPAGSTTPIIFEQRKTPNGMENFRTMYDFQTHSNRNIEPVGLEQLRASGSSEFSARGLNSIVGRISGACSRNNTNHGTIYVFDLREESHGAVNTGIPVSWMGEHNWGNKGLPHGEAIARESFVLGQIKAAKEAWISTEKTNKQGKTIFEHISVTNVVSEQQLVESAGARYVRLPVTDYMHPDDENVDQFIEIARHLPQDAWLHFHCKAGVGRTTVFLIMWDMLHNGERLTLPEITKRQGKLLDETSDLLRVSNTLAPWERNAALQRADFLRTFYEYAKTKPLDPGSPAWSEWVKARSQPVGTR